MYLCDKTFSLFQIHGPKPRKKLNVPGTDICSFSGVQLPCSTHTTILTRSSKYQHLTNCSSTCYSTVGRKPYWDRAQLVEHNIQHGSITIQPLVVTGVGWAKQPVVERLHAILPEVDGDPCDIYVPEQCQTKVESDIDQHLTESADVEKASEVCEQSQSESREVETPCAIKAPLEYSLLPACKTDLDKTSDVCHQSQTKRGEGKTTDEINTPLEYSMLQVCKTQIYLPVRKPLVASPRKKRRAARKTYERRKETITLLLNAENNNITPTITDEKSILGDFCQSGEVFQTCQNNKNQACRNTGLSSESTYNECVPNEKSYISNVCRKDKPLQTCKNDKEEVCRSSESISDECLPDKKSDSKDLCEKDKPLQTCQNNEKEVCRKDGSSSESSCDCSLDECNPDVNSDCSDVCEEDTQIKMCQNDKDQLNGHNDSASKSIIDKCKSENKTGKKTDCKKQNVYSPKTKIFKVKRQKRTKVCEPSKSQAKPIEKTDVPAKKIKLKCPKPPKKKLPKVQFCS